MILPNADRAFLDLRKLRDYSLNFESPKGRHKAGVFASALGITSENAEDLRDNLLKAVKENNAESGELDMFGQRYTVDFQLKNDFGEAMMPSGWIILHDEDFPA
ncbi:MAG TPA: hypothetical protein VF721_21520 [Pyrinomonadaceae bacterium]|jgi:hypothetical protein